MADSHLTNITGRIRVEATSPSNPVAGDMYFNTTNNYLMYYTGTAWIGVLLT